MPDEEEKQRYLSAEDDEETWTAVLKDVTKILDDEGIPHLGIGTLATTAFGYAEDCSDVDLLVARDDADRALKALDEHGFDTEKTESQWLYKAVKDCVLVDVIFAVGNDDEISADDEMFRRGKDGEVKGHQMRVVSPEDFAVMQAISNKEDAPDYWFKGLKALAAGIRDWEYLLERARIAPARVLSLLIYARTEGIEVPKDVLDQLYAEL